MLERLKRMFVLVEKMEEDASEELKRLRAERRLLEAIIKADVARIFELRQELGTCRERFFEKGWIAAAVWAGRDDLIADSPEYLKEILR